MAFHKLIGVKPLPGYLLLADFADGVQTCYNVTGLFERIPAFLEFQNTPGLFELVRVDPGGYGISWNDDLDLSADELYQNGMQTRTAEMLAPGACCPACGQMIRRKSERQAIASRANGAKGGRPKGTRKKLMTTK